MAAGTSASPGNKRRHAESFPEEENNSAAAAAVAPAAAAAAAGAADSAILTATAEFVKVALSGNDASHDWNHIDRVWQLTRTLATRELERDGSAAVDCEVAQLAAILHDIAGAAHRAAGTSAPVPLSTLPA